MAVHMMTVSVVVQMRPKPAIILRQAMVETQMAQKGAEEVALMRQISSMNLVIAVETVILMDCTVKKACVFTIWFDFQYCIVMAS